MEFIADGTTVFKQDTFSTLDSSGNGNVATLNGVTSTTGKINQGYSFDGSNDYVDSNFSPTGLTAFTIGMWIKSDNTPGGTERIFGTSTGSGDADKTNILVHLGTDNKLYYYTRNSANNQVLITAQGSVTTGVWTYITALYDGVNVKLYQDGVLLDTQSQTGTFNVQYDLAIGALNDKGSIVSYFDGTIDEVGIWSRALTNTEVLELYNESNGKQYPYVDATPTIIENKTLFFNQDF